MGDESLVVQAALGSALHGWLGHSDWSHGFGDIDRSDSGESMDSVESPAAVHPPLPPGLPPYRA
jgi:hypothetical protein